jgi:hypothetical protein
MDEEKEWSGKPTSKLKQSLATFLNCNSEDVQTEWEKLNPKEKLSLFRDLLTHGTSVLWATQLVWNAENAAETRNLTEDQVDEIVRRMHEAENKSGTV